MEACRQLEADGGVSSNPFGALYELELELSKVLSNRNLVKDRTQTEILEKYWNTNKAKEGESFSTIATPISPIPDSSRKAHDRSSSLTDGVSLFQPEHKLSPYHPAWSLPELLDRFGPLIFPIHRAALLRQRILISCHAPVHEICNFGMQPPPRN